MVTNFTLANTIRKENNEERRQVEAIDEKTEEQSVPFTFLSLVNNILLSFFPNVGVYIDNKQTHKPNGLYVQKFHFSGNFKRAISERMLILDCEEYH